MRSREYRRRLNVSDPLGGIERVRLSWRLLRDPRVPVLTRAALPLLAGIYVILPIDLIPDVILGLGQIDDIGVFGFAVFAMTKLLPKLASRDLVDEHLRDLRSARRGFTRRRHDVIEAEFTVIDRRDSGAA